MKIRTRAFLVLWLITILVAGTIGFIIVALNVASEPGRRASAHRRDPHRSRLAVARRWSSSSTISTTTAVPDLPSIQRAPAAPSGAPSTTTSRTRRRWSAIPNSATGCSSSGHQFDEWTATWDAAARDRSRVARRCCSRSANAISRRSDALLEEFDRARARDLRTSPSGC